MRHGFRYNEINGVPFLSVPAFDETGLCRTCFSTRLGGISAPPLDSMNLGFGRGDKREDVLENYRLLGEAVGFDASATVAFSQVHRADVCIATEADRGEAFKAKKREFDGIITSTPALPLATYHADCVPIFLLDTKNRVAGVCHAGWRGTAMAAPAAAISAMKSEFGSSASDILAAIGPSIGGCCFETDGDVPGAMLEAFGAAAMPFITDHKNGKFHVDLPGLNLQTLLSCGIPDDNITMSGECTCCKNDLFWSHRATGGIRGAMAAIITLLQKGDSQ